MDASGTADGRAACFFYAHEPRHSEATDADAIHVRLDSTLSSS